MIRGAKRFLDGGLGIQRRRGNLDTMSEKNMSFGFVLLTFFCFATGVGVARRSGSSLMGAFSSVAVLPFVLWMSMRLCEEGMASLREVLQCFALLTVKSGQL